MRRLDELPRMDADTKANILGVAAAGAVAGKRMSKNIEEKGHPFSHCEVKPLNLWQRICEHFGVTHIVDLTPGSAGLAIAATGAMEYEGVAANEIHCRWLDSTLDLVVKYIASKDKVFANKLGGDDDFAEKVAEYFGGTLLEAGREAAIFDSVRRVDRAFHWSVSEPEHEKVSGISIFFFLSMFLRK